MRIALLASNIFDRSTGQQKIQRAVSKALADLGHQVLILTNDRSGRTTVPEDISLDYQAIRILPGDATLGTYFRGICPFLRAVRGFPAELLLSFGAASTGLARLISSVNYIPWVHFAYEVNSFRSPAGRCWRMFLRRADRVLCSSRYLLDYFRSFDPDRNRYEVLKYNFADPRLLTAPGGRREAKEVRNVLYWGDAAPGRGLEVLLDAIGRFEEPFPASFTLLLRFVRPEFRERLKLLKGSSRVDILEGELPIPELRRHLSAADSVVLPYTRTTIQPPLTLLESAGAGLPVITTDLEANPEIIGGPGEGGILIPPGDRMALAEAIREMTGDIEHFREKARLHLSRETWLRPGREDRLREELRRIVETVGKSGRSRTAGIIALCGMDGSGKSTLAGAVADRLTDLGIAAEIIHGHEYAVSSSSFGISEDRIRRYRRLLTLLLPLAWLDNLYTYLTRYRPRARKRILLLDRYFYDKWARLIYFGICGRRTARFYARLLPRPRNVFFLDTPEEIAAGRKEGFSMEQLRVFRRSYLQLAEILEAPVLDSTEPPEIIAAKIFKTVLKQ